MFIPIFIAVLMGLLVPTNQTSDPRTGTVYVNFNGPISPNSTSQTDSIPPGDGGDGDGEGETGIGGPGGTGTGGGVGQNPPPPPKP